MQVNVPEGCPKWDAATWVDRCSHEDIRQRWQGWYVAKFDKTSSDFCCAAAALENPVLADQMIARFCAKNRDHPKCLCFTFPDNTDAKRYDVVLGLLRDPSNKGWSRLPMNVAATCFYDKCLSADEVYRTSGMNSVRCPNVINCIAGAGSVNVSNKSKVIINIKQECGSDQSSLGKLLRYLRGNPLVAGGSALAFFVGLMFLFGIVARILGKRNHRLRF